MDDTTVPTVEELYDDVKEPEIALPVKKLASTFVDNYKILRSRLIWLGPAQENRDEEIVSATVNVRRMLPAVYSSGLNKSWKYIDWKFKINNELEFKGTNKFPVDDRLYLGINNGSTDTEPIVYRFRWRIFFTDA